ncbi:uncharacterized protein F4822DRAFT_432466 [Hypoxylon trugodes]|uniref:uncharacterized protein n=1 Tax=Hypoxylon trugodes TaxID=326681 RepID=UPI0021963844|nr:uncharacterized protein F4822DRAFT_432466 [Hypoxylon trugodes]KAI1385610.1 hypothetical protein F4822DRAFT_432466 [Hypoxylon trugodes]
MSTLEMSGSPSGVFSPRWHGHRLMKVSVLLIEATMALVMTSVFHIKQTWINLPARHINAEESSIGGENRQDQTAGNAELNANKTHAATWRALYRFKSLVARRPPTLMARSPTLAPGEIAFGKLGYHFQALTTPYYGASIALTAYVALRSILVDCLVGVDFVPGEVLVNRKIRSEFSNPVSALLRCFDIFGSTPTAANAKK